jgi:hypothetical protein
LCAKVPFMCAPRKDTKMAVLMGYRKAADRSLG